MSMYRNCPSLPSTQDSSNVQLDEVPSPILSKKEMGDCTRCRALKDAMSGFPCSPRQGDFVSNGEFRVCKSACEMMLNSCGLPVHRGGLFTRAEFDGGGVWTGDYQVSGPERKEAKQALRARI